jgi:hypothetical protein
MLNSLLKPSLTYFCRAIQLAKAINRNSAQVSRRKQLAAQVQYEQAPKEVILQATKGWVESIVLRYKLCPFAVTAQKKKKILYRVSKSKTMEELQAEVLKHVRLMTKNNKKSETTKLLAVSSIERMYSFVEFNQFVNLMQELIETAGTPIQLAMFHPSFTYADATDDPESSTANYTSRSPYPLIHFIRSKQIEGARKKNGEAYLLGLSSVNDKTLAAVGLDKLRRMHKELLPETQYEDNMRKLSAHNSNTPTKTKFRANNKKAEDKSSVTKSKGETKK